MTARQIHEPIQGVENIRRHISALIAEGRNAEFDTPNMRREVDTAGNSILEAELQVPVAMSTAHRLGHHAGIQHFAAIRTVLDEVPVSQQDPETFWMRHYLHGLLLVGSERRVEAYPLLRVAVDFGAQRANAQWRCLPLLLIARGYLADGATIEAAEILAQAISLGTDVASNSLANTVLADLFDAYGQVEQALEFRRRSVQWRVDSTGKSVPRTVQLTVLMPHAVSQVESGDVAGARRTLDECYILVEPGQSPLMMSILSHIEAQLLVSKGEPEDALRLLDAEDKAMAGNGHLAGNLCIPLIRAEALVKSADPLQALKVLDEALAVETNSSKEVRMCVLATDAARGVDDWFRASQYQQRILNTQKRRRADSQSLLELHCDHARARSRITKNVELGEKHRALEQVKADYEGLLDMVTHDVMSPMTSLRMILSSLTPESMSDPAKQVRISQFEDTLARLRGIVDQLSAMEAAFPEGMVDSEAEFVPTDLVPIVSAVVDANRPLAEKKQISLDVEVVANLGPIALVAERPIVHILDNLISNAIKFSDRQTKVDLVISRSHGRRRSEDGIIIAVHDQGPGLTHEDLAHLFTRYGRLTARPTDGERSTGLGLYIAQRLARALGGELSALSPGRGQGSTFRLALGTNVEDRTETFSSEEASPDGDAAMPTGVNLSPGIAAIGSTSDDVSSLHSAQW